MRFLGPWFGTVPGVTLIWTCGHFGPRAVVRGVFLFLNDSQIPPNIFPDKASSPPENDQNNFGSHGPTVPHFFLPPFHCSKFSRVFCFCIDRCFRNIPEVSGVSFEGTKVFSGVWCYAHFITLCWSVTHIPYLGLRRISRWGIESEVQPSFAFPQGSWRPIEGPPQSSSHVLPLRCGSGGWRPAFPLSIPSTSWPVLVLLFYFFKYNLHLLCFFM